LGQTPGELEQDLKMISPEVSLQQQHFPTLERMLHPWHPDNSADIDELLNGPEFISKYTGVLSLKLMPFRFSTRLKV
jgi:hypothetical protein